MKDKNLWVGYLSLANKKTLVASDERVDTGNRKTIFLYNQDRNDIVEYSREIIQAKLSDAPESDYNTDAIASAFQKALRKSMPNLYRLVFTPNAGGSSLPKEKRAAPAPSDDEGMGGEVGFDDEGFDMDDDDGDDARGDD